MSRIASVQREICRAAGVVPITVPVVVLLVLLAAGCSRDISDYANPDPGSTSATGPHAAQLDRLAAARRAWAAARITDYDLVVGRSCFCLSAKVRVSVRDGVPGALALLPGSSGEFQATAPPTDLPMTVEALQDCAAQELATADQVDVTYSDLGVPTSIVSQGKLTTADDEVTYTAELTRVAGTTAGASAGASVGGPTAAASAVMTIAPSTLSTGLD